MKDKIFLFKSIFQLMTRQVFKDVNTSDNEENEELNFKAFRVYRCLKEEKFLFENRRNEDGFTLEEINSYDPDTMVDTLEHKYYMPVSRILYLPFKELVRRYGEDGIKTLTSFYIQEFIYICDIVRIDLTHSSCGTPGLSVESKMIVLLAFLTTGQNYRRVAWWLQLGEKTVSRLVKDVLGIVYPKLCSHFIHQTANEAHNHLPSKSFPGFSEAYYVLMQRRYLFNGQLIQNMQFSFTVENSKDTV